MLIIGDKIGQRWFLLTFNCSDSCKQQQPLTQWTQRQRMMTYIEFQIYDNDVVIFLRA